ncbi:MAG TPA: ATP:cob(I)alamin adenosyltransferase, partial [Saprospirales bacterium]|nr:ATP:cob(I)alamin adenosyltransferase [Saprospirales bacterium]
TSLFGGKKLTKDNLRIEAYGTIDELNANIGVLHSLVKDEAMGSELLRIQRNLFDLGAILATDPQKIDMVKPFDGQEINKLE